MNPGADPCQRHTVPNNANVTAISTATGKPDQYTHDHGICNAFTLATIA